MKYGIQEFTTKGYAYLALGLSTPDEEPELPYTVLTLGLFKVACSIRIPQLFKPAQRKVYAQGWDAATIARLGRDWYWHYIPREYRIAFWEEGVHITYGLQMDSYIPDDPMNSSRSKHYDYPWRYDHKRHTIYTFQGFKVDAEIWQKVDSNKYNCPDRELSWKHDFYGGVYQHFTHIDRFDGERVCAKAYVSEREWHRGINRFWSFFKYLPKGKMVIRSLEVEFKSEVGARKGSWKGGNIACSIPMLEGEGIIDAIDRFNDIWGTKGCK